MDINKKILISVIAFIVAAGLFAAGNASATKDLKKEQGPIVQTSSTVVSRPAPLTLTSDDTYHLEGKCAVFAYLDELDVNNAYSITHAIIAAGGQEDTLTVGLENCGAK